MIKKLACTQYDLCIAAPWAIVPLYRLTHIAASESVQPPQEAEQGQTRKSQLAELAVELTPYSTPPHFGWLETAVIFSPLRYPAG